MFPPTPDCLADVAAVHHPIDTGSPGADWLMVTAARAAEVQQQLAEGRNRDELLALHAHYAVEDPHFDPCEVAADLDLPLCHRAHAEVGVGGLSVTSVSGAAPIVWPLALGLFPVTVAPGALAVIAGSGHVVFRRAGPSVVLLAAMWASSLDRDARRRAREHHAIT